MENYVYLIKELDINKKFLQSKKDQTLYKIKYIVEYVKNWLFVFCKRKDIKNINFIDSMCNAGIYLDGDLGTATEVLLLFQEFCINYPEKNFNIFVNDININRIDIIKKIITKLQSKKNFTNLKVQYFNKDVNFFLKDSHILDNYLKGMVATILFVDPYNFKAVNPKNIYEFVKTYYCEIFYNFFSSDIVRNGELYIKNMNAEEIKTINDIEENFKSKIKKINKMSFSYIFKNSKKTEMYKIIFITPNIEGIVKLKDAIWKVFGGKLFYFNDLNKNQLPLFNSEVSFIEEHSNIAKSKLTHNFSLQTLSFKKIKDFILLKTIMKEGQIINNILKPLISEGKIIKMNKNGKKNYKDDDYEIL